ncbi:hypothetical protein BDN72DRAFT_844204 [Pluteus cervinus]|uniref:Uncharacterized protein n=1 Tax=Pluteus cervinus TaxID=181527 RepID=A0ACD3ALU8_9AGAR|nr:hypothetical protein BDN72DRAFT_844204 [Pluteus cervinus]
MYDDLPIDVIESIQRILGNQEPKNDDPLDAFGTDFDTVAVLNTLFPEESSLAHIEAVNNKLANTQRELQNEINSLQRELQESQDPNRMQFIQEMISDLLGQMSRIREKATESEAVVRNITKDIQVLDLAKKNLILSMTTLKRLQMLVNALTQVEDLVKERKYKEISQTLAAVKQISAAFKTFVSVKYISQIWKRIQEIQGELRGCLDADFDAYYLQDPTKPIKQSVIADACLVVDVLGADVRAHLVDRYVAIELKEYRRIFRTTDEAGQLDNLTRRFAWFRRLLQTHETEQGRVFPAQWKVSWVLLAKFVEITREDITGLLSKAGSGLPVTSLLEALQQTLEFEGSMVKRWATPFQEIINISEGMGPLPKPISAAFEPHMGVFVDAQDKAIADMLSPHRKAKNPRAQNRGSLDKTPSTDTEEDAPPVVVLPSSTELFYFYGQSLEQCSKLSTGKPLYDLGNVHRKWLRIYAEEVLMTGLKRPITINPSRKSMDTRHDPEMLRHACLMLNTADYCQTTAAELEEKLKEKIQDEYKPKVSFQDEHELFVGAVSAAINALVLEFELVCDPPLTSMARTSWQSTNHVTGQSAYVSELVQSAEQLIETTKPLVEQKKYLRNLFDKICSTLLAKFTTSLVRSRPLKEVGAEQLLIDLQVIKAYLTKMPGEALQTTAFTRGLAKHTSRIEALLKVIVTPVDPAEGFILNYTLLIGDASYTNFQKILDLKGTPNKEQDHLLDVFLTITSTKTELESASFLSSLDMDPSTSGSTLLSPVSTRAATMPLAAAGTAAESLFASFGPIPQSGPNTGSSTADSSFTTTSYTTSTSARSEPRREVFSDFKRFVSFGLRKDTSG